jgi:hypothetical protein
MKKVIIFLLALLPVMTGWAQPRKTVAVVPATGIEVSQGVRDGVTNGLQEGVVKSGQYRAVARDRDFEKALGEMKFQQSGAVADEQLNE